MPAKPSASTAPTQPQLDIGTIEQVTEFLRGALQANRISTLFVGRLLANVRDRKLYEKMGHPDLKSYCMTRLKLGYVSMLNYLDVYDFVQAHHPEWLEPTPGMFIPDLNDLLGLIWIRKELEKPDLPKPRQAALKQLQEKAETGTLKKAEMAKFRAHARNTREDGRKAFLSKLRALRAEGAKLAGIPDEVVSGLDDLIAILKNAIAAESAESPRKAKVA